MVSEREVAEQTVIVTDSLYSLESEGDRIRADIAEQTLRSAVERGYEIIVVDGGSPEGLLTEFKDLGAHVYAQEQKGMGNGRRQGFGLALETEKPVIARTEIEKVHYIPEIWKTGLPILGKEADLIIPRRNSLESYPRFQQLCEEAGNLYASEVTGRHLDLWFGPRTGSREIFGGPFMKYNGEFGDKWESIFMPVLNALLNGKRVMEVEVDYTHPESQTEFEKGNSELDRKRIEQLGRLTDSIERYWTENS
jgi:glycosyltransferase involved in cell wall biosynthesis